MGIQAITDEATRLYGILSGKIDMLIGLPAALNIAFATALVPAVSGALAKGDKKTAKRRISFSIRTTLLIALPCAVGMCVLAEPILNLLFPNAYAPEAALLLQISSFTIIFTLMNQTLGGALQGLGKVAIPAISLAIGACVKLILNLTLIPDTTIGYFGGIYGAAISSVVASGTAMIINLIVLHKKMNLDMNMTQSITKPVIATGIMGAIAFYSYTFINSLLSRPSLSTIIAIAIAVVSYLLLILIFNILDKEDYHMLPYGDKIYKFLTKIKLVKS